MAGHDADHAQGQPAISHPARVQILRVLGRCTTSVCGDILDDLPLPQSTVSQEPKVLTELGLIHGEMNGPWTCYCTANRKAGCLGCLGRGT